MRRSSNALSVVGPGWVLGAVVTALLAAQPRALQAGEVGLPLVRCIPPEQYDGGLQVFDLAQAPDGGLLFACPEDFAVFRHDGERWRRTSIGKPVLSLDVDGTGVSWLGSSGDFGFLREAPAGNEFVSVAEKVEGLAGQPPSFITTRCTRRGVFFLSTSLLVLWDGQHASTWRAPDDGGFMDVEAVGDDVYVLDVAHGLEELVNGELVASDALGAERVRFDALASDGRRLTGVWLDAAGLNWIQSGAERATLPVPELQRGPTYVSDVALTPDGGLAVATASGILLIDGRGGFRAWLDDRTGLPNSLAYSLLVDREGALWAGLAYGLARLDLAAATSGFGPELGLVGTPLALARHEGELYCGTFEGFFRLDGGQGRARFVRVKGAPALPVYDLLPTLHGLLIASEHGLALLQEDGKVRMLSEQQPHALARWPATDPAHEEKVIVANLEDLRVLGWTVDTGWRFEPPCPSEWNTDALAVDERGLWLHTNEHQLFRVPFDGTFGTPLPIPGDWLGIGGAPAGILAWTRTQLCFLPDAAPRPEPAPVAGLDWAVLVSASSRVRPLADEDGRLWLYDRRSLRRLQGTLARGVRSEAELEWAPPFALEGMQIDELDPRVVWLDTHAGLVRLALDGLAPAPVPSPLVSASAQLDGDAWCPLAAGTVLPPGVSLRVEVAAPCFDGTETSYRFRLEGLEHEWGAWSPLAVKEYTSLPGGAFSLHVQARHAGQVSAESRFELGVRVPWYRSVPAVMGTTALLLLLGFALVRWRSHRLERENVRLGRMVAERTQDLEAEKRRVLEHTRELERVNQRLVEESAAREAADAARRELRERLEEAERFESLGAVAGGIAHDFNNYLTSILGYAELAQDDQIGRGARCEYLDKIGTIAQQAAELCSGLLSLAGRAPLVTAPVELSRTVRGMESLLRMSVKDRAVLRMELAEGLPPVAGDVNQVRRALVNLVVNAAEASQGTRSPIVIRTGTQGCSADDLRRMHHAGECAPGPFVYIEVEDEGVGLAPESLRRIFDPFFSTKFVGRGLGLSTVFRIVSSHAGAIDVRSDLGRGTAMRLLFPASSGASSTLALGAPAGRRPELAGQVLVVDDDPAVRELTRTLCQRLGLEVACAAGGPEALAQLASTPRRFSAVLLDLSMPGMGGLEVLERIRRVHRDLAVLLVSGYADQIPREALDDATWFLPKPFTLESLAVSLERALRDVIPRPDPARSLHG